MDRNSPRNDTRHAADFGRLYAHDLASRLFGVRPVAAWPVTLTIHPRDAALFGDASVGSPAALAFAVAAQERWIEVRAEYAMLTGGRP